LRPVKGVVSRPLWILSRRTSFGYILAREKKKIMNSDELDSSEPVVHLHTRSS
jgi:hypothetical protein